MSDTGFNILNGNSVSGVPDASIIELRVYDHADGSLVQAVPLDLARGQFVVSVDAVITASWPDEIRAEIYVNYDGAVATKSITPSEAFSYFRRDLGDEIDNFNEAASSAAGLILLNLDETPLFGNPVYGVPFKIRALWVDGDGNYAGEGTVNPMDTNLGSEVFDRRVGTTNYNQYIVTPPATGTGPAVGTFIWGRDDFQGNPQIAQATVTYNVTNGSGATSTVETTSKTTTTFSTRLTLDTPQPAQLWYRIQGESNFTQRVPHETSSNFDVHNQTAPGTEGKTLSAEDVIEYYWLFGTSLENRTATASVTLNSSATGGVGSFENIINLNAISLKSPGQFTDADWTRVSGLSPDYSPSSEHHLSTFNEGGLRILRQAHVATSRGSDRVIAPLGMPEARTIRIKQTFRFANNFTWGDINSQNRASVGGKAGFGVGSGSNPAGGLRMLDGSTLRPSFSPVPNIGPNPVTTSAYMDLYSYAATRDNGGNSDFGEIYETDFVVTGGDVVVMEIEARINSSFGARDGYVKAWFNGSLEIDVSGIGWQTQSYQGLARPYWNRLLYSEFHGGGDSNFAPDPSPTYIDHWDMSWETDA